MDNQSKIRDIFYSGGFSFTGSSELTQEIAFLVEEGYLALKEFIVASRQDYLKLLNDTFVSKDEFYDAAGGSAGHAALKILAGRYLSSSRGKKPLYEHPFCGYYPDVMSDDGAVVVECGHTQNPDKIFTYFKQGNVKELIQVPYPAQEDEAVIGYSFLANYDLAEFLEFWQKEKHSELKNILRRRR